MCPPPLPQQIIEYGQELIRIYLARRALGYDAQCANAAQLTTAAKQIVNEQRTLCESLGVLQYRYPSAKDINDAEARLKSKELKTQKELT
ncbi:hypothetical protein CEXT_788041 [Caerostris extrusa]|uniref:Uncharacterized protein n=1 Tax=Caerostris extrusa TaxID=172846 RepID=A0AAV4T6X8_CAEEX|nr:hypothetical protein CEXT_788041 [Caerostris extrusa]